MYVAQQSFGLSDEGIEDAIYDNQAIGCFVGIDLSRESAPDATTLLECHQLIACTFNTIAHHLAAKKLLLCEGTIVDATLIDSKLPLPLDQKQGGQARFGDAPEHDYSGLVRTEIGTTGNVSDISQAEALLHGQKIWSLPTLAIRALKNARKARVAKSNGKSP